MAVAEENATVNNARSRKAAFNSTLSLQQDKIVLKRYLSLLIVGVLIHGVSVRPIFTCSQADKGAQLAAKVKASIAKLGTGETARVSVKLQDQRRVKGYVSETSEDSFCITDPTTGQAYRIAYSEVTQVKRNGLSRGAKIAIGIGIGAGVGFAVIAILVSRQCKPTCD